VDASRGSYPAKQRLLSSHGVATALHAYAYAHAPTLYQTHSLSSCLLLRSGRTWLLVTLGLGSSAQWTVVHEVVGALIFYLA